MTVVSSPTFANASELQHLTALLPTELQHYITFKRAVLVNSPLIQSEKCSTHCAIQIDLIRWQQLTVDQRSLLLWHEVIRIQNHSVGNDNREITFLVIAGVAGIVEIWTQNIPLLSLVLLVAGLAGFQLYQKRQGEGSLRAAHKADQGAIALAAKFGYTRDEAYEFLSQALKALIIQTHQQRLQKKYRTRLQALKILHAEI